MEANTLDYTFLNHIPVLFGYTMEDVKSKKRDNKLCEVRRILSVEMRKFGLTYQEIGDFLNRDHSTVLWNIKGYEDKILYDEIFRKKVHIVEKIKGNMLKILLPLDNSKLLVLNSSMTALDTMELQDVNREYKSYISICMELRTDLLQKAVKSRQKDKSFILKLPFYKAEALYQYLTQFEIYFPDNFGKYESNAILSMRNELHKQII